MIYLTQAFAAFFAALVISKTWSDFRKGQEALPVFIFWTGAWTLIVVLTFFPQLVDLITRALEGRVIGMNRIFGMSFVFIFYVVYRIYLKANRVEKEMAQLVRDMALKNERKRR
jgi:hypothetical protein